MLALEIAREDLELKLVIAERCVRDEVAAKRKLERKRQYADRGEVRAETLLEIPCDVWLPALTQVEVPRGRRVSCPLPGHDDNEPSCRLHDTWFYCYSCNRGGNVFNFAGELWDIDHKTRFPELVKLLAERLL